jgi:hypothetical protein
MMEVIRGPRQQTYCAHPAEPLWFRPWWWLWTGLIGLLVVVLALGTPLLCLSHCWVHQALGHTHHHGGNFDAGHGHAHGLPGAPAPSEAPGDSHGHSLPQALIEALLLSLPLVIIIRQRRVSYQLPLHPWSSWLTPPLQPPPRSWQTSIG